MQTNQNGARGLDKTVRCDGCVYWKALGGFNEEDRQPACHYFLDTGRLRMPLRAWECYRHAGTPYTPCCAQQEKEVKL